MKIISAVSIDGLCRVGRLWVLKEGAACAGFRTGLFIFVAVAGTLAGRAGEPRLLDAGYLDSLRTEVRTNHPTVAAAQARVLAAEAGVRAVRLWDDPAAGLGLMVADREMRMDDGDILIGVEQMLPRRRLYEARKARAGAERAIHEAEKRAAALHLETLVAQSAIELALTDEIHVLETSQFGWLESMSAVSREQLKDPAANASEPLRLESEAARERLKIDTIQRQRTRVVRQLNILLGRSMDEAWPRLRLPERAGSTPELAGELAQIYEVNPMFHVLHETAEAARSEIQIARRERSPAFSVGVESGVYSGGEFRQATVGAKMTLPWFNNSVYRANTERALQQQGAAEKETEALARRLVGDAVAAHTEAETSARQAQVLFEEVIPRAGKAAEATENAWIGSRASVLEVLEARRSLLAARLEERRFIAAHQSALETLRSIVPPNLKP